MKTPLLAVLALLLVAASAAADSSNNGTTSASKDRPTLGMTKAQAAAYYGEPFTRGSVEKGGERWYYRLKFNEVYGRAFVPFYYDSANVRWGSIDFGPDGRVRAFDWQAPRLSSSGRVAIVPPTW